MLNKNELMKLLLLLFENENNNDFDMMKVIDYFIFLFSEFDTSSNSLI